MPDEKKEITSEEQLNGAEGTPNTKPAEGAEASNKEKEDEWFVPGKYRTQADAIKNQDKQLFNVANTLNRLNEVIAELKAGKPAPTTGSPEDKGASQEELQEAWDQLFRENPSAAMLQWEARREADRKTEEENRKKALKDEVKGEVKGEIVWQTFLDNNPEVNNKEKVDEIVEVLRDYPRLARRKDAFLVAKEIVLTEGETLDDKVEAWYRKDKKAEENKPPKKPVVVPSGGTNKGEGSQPNDNYAVFKKAVSG